MTHATGLTAVALTLLALAATAVFADQPVISMKPVCTPIKTARVNQTTTAPNPRGGWSFIGQCMNYKSTGDKEKTNVDLGNGRHYTAYVDTKIRPEAEWVLVDLRTGTQKTVKLPGFHTTRSCLTGNGRVFFSVDYAHIFYYEPTEETIKIMARVCDNINVLRGFYRLEVGPDGMVYGASQSTNGIASVIRIDPDTLDYKLIDKVGVPGRRKLTYGYYIGMEPPWLYVAVGQGQWELWAVNFETGEKTMLAERTGKGARVVVSQGKEYCVAQLHGAPERVNVALRDGKIVETQPNGKRFEFTPDAKVYEQVEWKQTKPLDLGPAPELDRARHAAVYGEGQGVFYWRSAGTEAWQEGHFAIKNTEAPTMESLTLLPDGSVLGSSEQYHGWWRYTPATGKHEYYGKGGPSGAKLTLCDGKLYFAGYPNANLSVFDPATPWTAEAIGRAAKPDDNPRPIGSQGQGRSEAHHAIAMASLPGRVYTLGLRERWAKGAGLCCYIPASGKFIALGKENQDLHPVSMIAMPGRKQLIVSGAKTNAKLLVYDADLKAAGEIEIAPGLDSTGYLLALGKDRFLGWYVAPGAKKTTVYTYDLAAGKKSATAEVEGTIVWITHRPADNTCWLLTENTLSRLDPTTLALTPVGVLDNPLNMPTRGGRSVHRSRPLWVGKALYGSRNGSLLASQPID